MIPTITYLIDARFPGGTSAAVAAELAHVRRLGRLTVACLTTPMFPAGQPLAPVLETAFTALGIEPLLDPAQVSGDLVVLHNPAMLKFGGPLPRIAARRLTVVTHENFTRPGGAEGFDVPGCLEQIDRAALALDKCLAPVSAYNRANVGAWLTATGAPWRLAKADWFNIAPATMLPPSPSPQDRRGRLSRPGWEKFPSPAALDACFPPTADRNLILGADTLMAEGATRPHWTLVPFRGMEVAEFFAGIDFMVYFTSPALRESYGRVIAEGIAAGKVVITDPETAAPFGPGVIGTTPDEVSGIVRALVDRPADYARLAIRAQADLAAHSGAAFSAMAAAHLPSQRENAA